MPVFSCQIQWSANIYSNGLMLAIQRGSSCQPFILPFNRVFDMTITTENSIGKTTLTETLRLSEFLPQMKTYSSVLNYTFF